MASRLSSQAETDLANIWGYVAREAGNPDIADRLIDALVERFLLLSRCPRLGRRRDEELRPGLRTFPVGDYIVLYHLDGEDAVILRVVRGSRDIDALLG